LELEYYITNEYNSLVKKIEEGEQDKESNIFFWTISCMLFTNC
jgi:hypothetical protein